MIKVGFLLKVAPNWMGELNYMKNLLYAINSIENKEIETIVFISKNMDSKLKMEFSKLSTVIEIPFMKRKSFNWLIWKVSKKVTNSDFLVEYFLRKYKIDIFSHSSLCGLKKSRSIDWIPDFQHLHLPDMFSYKEIERRNKDYSQLSRKSDVIVLSSFDALKDYKIFTKENINKAKVLQFVCQPGEYVEDTDEFINNIRLKYKVGNDYFMISNQFWKHKNHMTVFKALSLLKEKGYNFTLVCTGYLNDYRNMEYSNQIRQYISNNQIDVRLLGLIDYNEMINLLKYSVAVINPSFFEGWNSTVEECKSLGKNMILSDISVHREQNPANSFYFNPNHPEELSQLLEHNISHKNEVISLYDKTKFDESIRLRTIEFAKKYESIVRDLYKNS